MNTGDPSSSDDTGYSPSPASGQRGRIYDIGWNLKRQATALAQESFNHFRDWNGAISDQEQAILFKSEALAASCRLFLKLTESQSDYFRSDYLRANLFSSFTFLASSFKELEQEMKQGNLMPYALSDCRRILGRLEQEFGAWPDADNIAYLDQKYVKASDATVYLIEKKSMGTYAKRPFKNLESVFRYNYDRNWGKNPWDHLVETSGRDTGQDENGCHDRPDVRGEDDHRAEQPEEPRASTSSRTERSGRSPILTSSRGSGVGQGFRSPRARSSKATRTEIRSTDNDEESTRRQGGPRPPGEPVPSVPPRPSRGDPSAMGALGPTLPPRP